MGKVPHKHARVVRLVAMLGYLLLPVVALADPITLGSRTIDTTIGFPTLPADSTGLVTLNSGGLFTWLVTAADIGRTLSLDATTDPAFETLATRFTNGRANFVGYLFGPTAGGGGGLDAASEQAFFHLRTLDFAGSTISALTLTVHEFSSGPWQEMAGYTQMHLNADLAVQGTAGATPTPEPSTLLLLTGAAAAVFRRRATARPVRSPLV